MDFTRSFCSATMLLPSFTNNFEPYLVIFTAVVLSSALWYYIFVFKPYAKFPAWRLEFRIPYWILNRRKLDIVILKKLIEQARRYKAEGIFVTWVFKPLVVVYGEEILKSIVPHTSEKPFEYKIFEFALGKGLLVSNGERWKKQTKLISPAFHTKALRMYVSFMNNNAKTLVKKLSEKKEEPIVDMSHVLSECTLRLFFESSLGVREADSKKAEKTIKIFWKFSEFFIYRLFRVWYLQFDFMLPLFSYARKILQLEVENRETIIQILEQIKKSMTDRDQSEIIEEEHDRMRTRSKSIGEILIEDRLKLPHFSMDDLAREISELMYAGFNTTAHALMWTFYSLGLHPEIQDRVHDEIVTLTDDDIQYASVRDLTYLDCVIKESLRMYPVPLVGRRVKEDVQCGNYIIPKNTRIVFLCLMFHRDPNIYPEPEKFDPDRFMDKNSKIKPWNYMPFMEGVRPCIGKSYAMLLMKIFLVHVLRNFTVISLDREEDLTFKWSLVLRAETEPRMKFIPRY